MQREHEDNVMALLPENDPDAKRKYVTHEDVYDEIMRPKGIGDDLVQLALSDMSKEVRGLHEAHHNFGSMSMQCGNAVFNFSDALHERVKSMLEMKNECC